MEREPKAQPIEPGAGSLSPPPLAGRTFTTTRRVSVADADRSGRMELDAIARFLQDAGNDDTDDAGLSAQGLAWVARRAAIEIHHWAGARENLRLTTWCSGTGSRWAERRTSAIGEAGAHIETAAIWVHFDADSERPVRWGDDFAARYLEAAGGRQVDAKLRHEKSTPDDAVRQPWAFRATDMDAFGHVNNAAYLALAEEYLTLDTTAARVEIEWRGPSVANEPLTAHVGKAPDGSDQIWVRSASNDELRVTITVSPFRG